MYCGARAFVRDMAIYTALSGIVTRGGVDMLKAYLRLRFRLILSLASIRNVVAAKFIIFKNRFFPENVSFLCSQILISVWLLGYFSILAESDKTVRDCISTDKFSNFTLSNKLSRWRTWPERTVPTPCFTIIRQELYSWPTFPLVAEWFHYHKLAYATKS